MNQPKLIRLHYMDAPKVRYRNHWHECLSCKGTKVFFKQPCPFCCDEKGIPQGGRYVGIQIDERSE